MEIEIHANMVDHTTEKIADVLTDVFDILCNRLNGDYGGIIEHLWISFELIENHAKPDCKPRFPFRFQKRVSGRSPAFGLPPCPDYFNVGHFSVRPDFPDLLSMPKNDVVPYCLNLIYKELVFLKTKEKKLGGLNSELLINRFCEECKILGYSINLN